jgi:hypothetical protein
MPSFLAMAINHGSALAKALDLPMENLAGFTLSVQAGECITCQARYYVPVEGANEFVSIIRNFEVVERKAVER